LPNRNPLATQNRATKFIFLKRRRTRQEERGRRKLTLERSELGMSKTSHPRPLFIEK